MVHPKNILRVEDKKAPFNGTGEIIVRNLVETEEMYGKGRVFAHTTVKKESAIGYHVHNNEAEIYYILSGKAKFNDNGTIVEIGPGDVTYTGDGEGHGIEAIGSEPVEMIALILYK